MDSEGKSNASSMAQISELMCRTDEQKKSDSLKVHQRIATNYTLEKREDLLVKSIKEL